MSGSIGLILTAIVLLGGITDPSWQVKLFILACWIAFFLSMIVAWKKERDRVNALSEQLHIASAVKRPKLVGFIYGIVL
jgi:hypothetical protein